MIKEEVGISMKKYLKYIIACYFVYRRGDSMFLINISVNRLPMIDIMKFGIGVRKKGTGWT